MDYRRLIEGVTNAFVTERSTIGPVPLLALNWAAVAFPAFLTYRAWGTDEFAITLAFTAGVLLIVLGLSFLLVTLRTGRRRRFYSTVKHALGVPSYNEYSKDSSRFVKMRWQFLKPTQITFKITVSNLRMSTIKSALNDLDSMFAPSSGKRWVVNLGLLRQGTFVARVVDAASHESLKFDATMTLTEVARDQLGDINAFPINMTFIGERVEGQRFAFDEVTIDNTRGRLVGKSATDKLVTLFERAYPPREDMTWMLDQSDGSVYRVYQSDKYIAKAIRNVRGICSDQMLEGFSDDPKISFINERVEGARLVFDAVQIDELKSQGFSDYKAQRLTAAFTTAFPVPRGLMWTASMSENTLYIERVPLAEGDEPTETPVAKTPQTAPAPKAISRPVTTHSSLPARPAGMPPRPVFKSD